MPLDRRLRWWICALIALPVLVAGCTSTPNPTPPGSSASTSAPTGPVPGTAVSAAGADAYLGSYTVDEAEYGTKTTVSVADGKRTITTNALPNHKTGEFPNPGNPNSISPQDRTWTFPLMPTWTGNALSTRVSGVAVNGIKLEPGTAETVTCTSGERYAVEAIEDTYNLGLDLNNAHVQPNGEYHYHGVSKLLVDAYSSDQDLVLLGFAPDGYLIYYSKSGAYRPGYALVTKTRTGTECTYSIRNEAIGDLAGSAPDGTYSSDYQWSAEAGDLDECNGTEINGEYAYLITDTYPFIGRCLNGVFDEATGGGGPPPEGGVPPTDGPPPPPPPPSGGPGNGPPSTPPPS